MDKLKSIGSDLTDPNSASFKVAVGLVIFIIICLVFYRKQKKYYEQNPAFLKEGHDASKYKKFDTALFPKSNEGTEMTLFWWMYVDNMHQGYNTMKHVLTKGSEGGWAASEQCPSVWIDGIINDLTIKISTTTETDTFKIVDFPVRTWFSIAVVTKGTQADFYKNGKLEYSKNLSGYAKLNTGSLHVCDQNYGTAEAMAASVLKRGFSGKISCIHYFPSAKGPRLIGWKHANGHICMNMFQKIWKSLNGSFSKLRNTITIDVDLKTDPDIPKYKVNSDSKCKGSPLTDLGPVSIQEAQTRCNANAACDCITEMTEAYGTLEKGNMRLMNNPSMGSRIMSEPGFKAYTVERSLLSTIYDGVTQNDMANNTIGAAGDFASEVGETVSEAALGEN